MQQRLFAPQQWPKPGQVLSLKQKGTGPMPSSLGNSTLALFKPNFFFFFPRHKSIAQSSLVSFWEVKWGYPLFLRSPSFYYLKFPPMFLERVDVQSCPLPGLPPATAAWAKAAGKLRLISRSPVWNGSWLWNKNQTAAYGPILTDFSPQKWLVWERNKFVFNNVPCLEIESLGSAVHLLNIASKSTYFC